METHTVQFIIITTGGSRLYIVADSFTEAAILALRHVAPEFIARIVREHDGKEITP